MREFISGEDSLIIRETHIEEYEIKIDANGHLIEPKCPECRSGVSRPKCFLELGGGCPRHGISDAYDAALRQDPTNHIFKSYGYRPEECALCHKQKEVHQ